MAFTVGQRWVSQSEPKLGLGIISEIENRRVSISFPAAGESRTYAIDNAPISRVIYKTGDQVSNHEEQSFTVQDIEEQNALLTYHVLDHHGEKTQLSEVDLNCFIAFTSPLQRLMSGHYDRSKAFRLRYETLQHLHRLQQSQVSGLIGSRTSLLPHQIYIANRVAERHFPRVLLADEVGLGKTIEAGMILHAQLHKGLAKRALIVVPSTLIHQWLVEMLRRFNLRFAIFDQNRFDALTEEGIENPFETEQLILCDINFISANQQAQQQALDAEWDLLVVDEAHHLHWSETEASPEYQCIERLSQVSHGVLLLTATPEQAGIDSHFARLRLLDPDRFHSLPEFIAQEQNYAKISELVGELLTLKNDKPLDPAWVARIADILGEASDIDFTAPASESIDQAVQQLLDQHGTGRILFRNTRQGVEGFPQRILTPHLLQASDPEEGNLRSDPHVQWLTQFLSQIKPEKALVICASAERALQVEGHLRLKEGLRTAAFYEGLSIIERDRAAAYFADKEDGAQALICSEIGSEGRNFQFAHNLVLLDLPENPDLLEQRIGRLDRIGQTEDVQIHVPYLAGSRQEGLYRWYDEGLNAFTQSCAAGFAIYEQYQDQLATYLQSDLNNTQAEDFISNVRQSRDHAMAELQKGRDPLLELNSCNPVLADKLIEQVEWEEESQELATYMDHVFTLYGVEHEQQSDSTMVIHPGEHMLTHDFPGLSAEGCTLTYHRLKALVREDVEFLTWEHPMVTEIMDQTLSTELGNAALSTMSVKGVQPGTLFLEAIFALNSMAPKQLQLDRFLPISPQRIVVNITGKDLSEVLAYDKLNQLVSGLKRKMAHAVVKEIREQFETLLSKAQSIAEQKVPDQLSQAKAAMTAHLDTEIQRLIALQKKNPLIRDEEITFLKEQKAQCLNYIEKTALEIQGMRVIINT